jgi:hypothetical protein
MTPDVPAGLGYLAVGLAAGAADIALVINRERVAQWYSDQFIQSIDEAIAARDRAPRRTRRLYWRYGDARLRDVETRSRIPAVTGSLWIGFSAILTIVALLMIASAVAEFAR